MNREEVKPKNRKNTTQQTRSFFFVFLFFLKELDLKHLGQVEDKQALDTWEPI